MKGLERGLDYLLGNLYDLFQGTAILCWHSLSFILKLYFGLWPTAKKTNYNKWKYKETKYPLSYFYSHQKKKKKNGAKKTVEGCEIESESFVLKEKIQLKYKSSEDEK